MSLTKVSYSMIQGEVGNALDYGAVADGTTNSTTAIANALADNDVVYLPEGTYRVVSLSIPAGKTLTGAGRTTILKIVAASTGSVILTTSKNNWTLSNLTLHGDATSLNVLLATTCVGAAINNVEVTDSAGYGLVLDNCSKCSLDTIDVYDSGALSYAAIYLKNPAGDGAANKVTNCLFTGNEGRGIFNLGNNFTQISNVTGYQNSGVVLLIENSYGCTVTNIQHLGNEPAAGSLSDGIAINGNSFYNSINGFMVANNAGHGVSINGQAGRTGASYNNVSNGTIVNSDEGGVVITDQGVSGSVPVGNVVSNVVSENAGISIPSESFGVSGGTDNLFVNCVSKNSGVGTTTYGFSEVDSANSALRNSFTGRLLGTYSVSEYALEIAGTSSVHQTNKITTDTWVTFNASGTVSASSNVLSVVKNSTGNYTINYLRRVLTGAPISSLAMFTSSARFVNINNAPSNGAVTIQVTDAAGVAQDSDYISVRVG